MQSFNRQQLAQQFEADKAYYTSFPAPTVEQDLAACIDTLIALDDVLIGGLFGIEPGTDSKTDDDCTAYSN